MSQKPVRLLTIGLMLVSFMHTVQAADPDPALVQVIESRSAEDRARDAARHPAETLTFFEVRPGMVVAEVLPGGGWYTSILANYLGGDGVLYGVNYSDRMWPMFSFATDEWTAGRIASTAKFPDLVKELTDNGIQAQGFTFNTVPSEIAGTVDRVLLIRALHNLSRFEAQAGTRTQALAAIQSMLKADGMVGVVQHRLQDVEEQSGTDGSRGYMLEADVIEVFEDAGFELVATSEINANPNDRPTAKDTVWRLPPGLRVDDDDPDLKARMQAIGESDRMTLLFRKAPSI